MITASDAVLTAVGFLGLGFTNGATRPAPATEADPTREAEAPASAELLSAGEPYFEAVAAALRITGYLDS